MKLNSARQAWHDAYFMPWAQSIEMIELGCRVQKTQHDKSTSSAMHQALAGCIQRAVDTLPNYLREFGHHLYSPLAGDDERETAEELVYLIAYDKSGRMTASKAERARYVAMGVVYRYRAMNQGGQGEGVDSLLAPETFRAWLDAQYGIKLNSEAWGRDWAPFVEACFDTCNDLDRQALRPVSEALKLMVEAA